MNGGKSDASTSTDDVKDRPLCLFYFTHPFGVLSPEPPVVTAAPPAGEGVARAFLNMQPLSPLYWVAAAAAAAASSPAPEESCRSPSPSVHFELGATQVHARPLTVRGRRSLQQLARGPPRGAGGDVWFPRRMPLARMLPPLRLRTPPHLADSGSGDIWPASASCLTRFSLPPIEMPRGTAARALAALPAPPLRADELSALESISVSSAKELRSSRKLRVRKMRWRGRGRGRGAGGDVRRMVTCLMRRVITGAAEGAGTSGLPGRGSPAPALQRALATIRAAWAEPASLTQRCRVLRRMYTQNFEKEEPENTIEKDSDRDWKTSAMLTRKQQVAELTPRAGASPGLLRRRYSVPEAIMRKYRLAQQNSDTEVEGRSTPGACGACPSLSPPRSAGESPRHLRRDRELMRKSALLRRLWARPPPAALPCRCDARSLGASRDELRPEPARPECKRQRREWRAPPSPSLTELSDSTRGPDLSCVDTTYALSEGSTSPPPASPRVFSPACDHCQSDSFSASISTAKEALVAVTRDDLEITSGGISNSQVGAQDSSAETDGRVPYSSERLVCDGAAPYEVLEIVVSESSSSSPPDGTERAAAAPRGSALDLDIDEYVSRVLVESLNSLTDRLEGMNASVGAEHKLSVVEKEIKVRLQNAAVNTIVHLSPTSNHQIIFGNEELCGRTRGDGRARPEECDECNNPRAPLALLTPLTAPEDPDNNNETPRADVFDAVIQHDGVNRAVLRQIQKLFHDELRHEDAELSLRDDAGAVSLVEITRVDAFHSDSSSAPLSGVGAGNYFRDLERAALVPRHSAMPHSASMEVNTSEEEEAEPDALVSDAASLVDSLDDPDSPRFAQLRRAPLSAAPPEAFFVPIRDDATPEGTRVAEYMPERIKQRLHRRHRKRELRLECARRGRVRRLQEELQARRRDQLERDAAAMLDGLLDDVVADVARAETRAAARDQRAFSRSGRWDADGARERRREARRRRSDDDEERRSADGHQPRGSPPERPTKTTGERAPRRIYQKSEIHEGNKCIEILEILEYSHASRSSSDSAPSEKTRARRSRIPVPVGADHMRLTGGDAPPYAHLLLRALAPAPPLRPLPSEPRSNSLRFKRVFDMIPEERTSLSFDSSVDAEETDGGRRASAPNITEHSAAGPGPAPAPAPAAAAAASPRRMATRSAGTSPPAPGEARRQRSQTTMTSPSNKSAATSPWRVPPPRPPPPREGPRETRSPERPERRSVPTQCDREKRVEAEMRGAEGWRRELTEHEAPAGTSPGAPPGTSPSAESGGSSSSGDSGGSLLCSLAPRWLSGHARQRRRARRTFAPDPPPRRASDSPLPGGWSVTVAGSCSSALPADVEMRLRFPQERRARPAPAPHERAQGSTARSPTRQECGGPECCAAPALPAAPQERLTLPIKKEPQECSIVARKGSRKSSEQLPALEAYRASRAKHKGTVKTRRGCSLHCWLPADELAPARTNNGLSVLGCAIIPELKPRVPTMSERDLTRVYTPRHYLRS